VKERCYFCGQETKGKRFDGQLIDGTVKQYPICNDCDGPDLHEGEEQSE
jgi:hypothetical protein